MNTVWMNRLQVYIESELNDAVLYRELAKKAVNQIDRQLLLEFAEDEQAHAQEFQKLYRQMFNQSYNPSVSKPSLDEPFADILRNRVLDESGDFHKYSLAYLEAKNDALKKQLYHTLTDENVHTMRLLYMLSRY